MTLRAVCVALMTTIGAANGVSPASEQPMHAAPDDCAPSDGLNYICGPIASEDLARIADSPWLIVSGMNVGSPAHLYLVDDRTKSAAQLFPLAGATLDPDPELHARCAGPPDLAKMSLDGLNIRAGPGGLHLLYAANHGDRYSIEIFRIDARGPVPQAAWIGCVVLPPGNLPNAVVPLADGGLLISSFYDPRDKTAWTRMERAENTGAVWEWHAASGFQRLKIGGISGANGLEISADESTVYASAWSGRKLLIFDRRTQQRREIPLEFLPDNIKRAADGTLLVAGQRSSVARIAACGGPDCEQDWTVVRVDPSHGTVSTLITRTGSRLINYACGALQLGTTLYITARGDRRLAYLPISSLPSTR